MCYLQIIIIHVYIIIVITIIYINRPVEPEIMRKSFETRAWANFPQMYSLIHDK